MYYRASLRIVGLIQRRRFGKIFDSFVPPTLLTLT